jgi:hypothetical protein
MAVFPLVFGDDTAGVVANRECRGSRMSAEGVPVELVDLFDDTGNDGSSKLNRLWLISVLEGWLRAGMGVVESEAAEDDDGNVDGVERSPPV